MRRCIAANVVAAAILLGCPGVREGAAEPPTDFEVRKLVARAAKRPSVHADRTTIDDALEKAGVSRATIARLWHAVDAAVLPESGGRLEEFLLLTREPEWLALRDHFAEFLSLRGIERIEKKTVARIRSHPGVHSFPDLHELDVDSARRLRWEREDWQTAVELPAVRSLTPEAAEAIAKCPAMVVLPALTELSPETAAALARHHGPGVVLGGLRRLDPAAAEALAAYPHQQHLLLPDLESLDSIPLAWRLADQEAVFLPRVPRLSTEVAAVLLGDADGTLVLPGLVDVPEPIASRLAEANVHGITLDGGALTPVTARVLAPHPGPLVLTGTRGISVAVAAALDSHAGDLVLQHVARLPAAVAAALPRAPTPARSARRCSPSSTSAT